MADINTGNSLSAVDEILVYPNPATDNIFINIPENIETTNNDKAELIDILGAVKATWYIKNGENNMDISNLPSGVYFLKINNKNEMKTFRILIK
jgi:hypothetical protein